MAMEIIHKKYFLVVFITFSTYVPSLFWCREYLFDDTNAIQSNPDVIHPNRSLAEIFHHDFWGADLKDSTSHKSYRPLTIIVYRLLHSFGGSIFAYRVFNNSLHAFNTLLVCKLGRILHLKGWFLGALIFGLHPVHSEPVLALVGTSDLICSQIILSALILVLVTSPETLSYAAASLLSLLAVMYKEQGIMLLPMVLILDGLHKKNTVKGLRLKIVFCLLICSMILYWRLFMMDFKTPKFQMGDNPASFLPTWSLRAINVNYVYAINLILLLVPIWQCFDWSMGCIPTIQNPGEDPRTLAVIFFWLSCLLALKQLLLGRRKYLLVALLGLLPFIPSMNIFFRVGFVIAERNLYLSILGLSLLIGEGYEVLTSKWNVLGGKCFFKNLTLFIFMMSCIKRSKDWSSEGNLYRSGLRVCPLNAKIYYNIAKRESEAYHPQLDKVIKFYETSLSLWPNYEHAMNNLGNAYRSIKAYGKARSLYENALKLSPTFATCWMNLGILHTATGNYEDAESSYQEALKWRRGYSDCHYNLGILYIKMKRLPQAKRSFLESIRLKPRSLKSWINLVILLDEMKSFPEAKEHCQKALEFFPHSPDLTFHLANIYGNMEEKDLAEKHYLQAISTSSEEKLLYHLNLGILYHRSKQFEKAKHRYKKVLSLDPNNPSANKYLSQLESNTL